MAFAPRENPKIALSVYVENAGAGGDWAAPIAGLLVEKYVLGSVNSSARESRILEATYPLDPDFDEEELSPSAATPTSPAP